MADTVGLSYGERYLVPRRWASSLVRAGKHGWIKRRIPTRIAKTLATGILLVAIAHAK